MISIWELEKAPKNPRLCDEWKSWNNLLRPGDEYNLIKFPQLKKCHLYISWYKNCFQPEAVMIRDLEAIAMWPMRYKGMHYSIYSVCCSPFRS